MSSTLGPCMATHGLTPATLTAETEEGKTICIQMSDPVPTPPPTQSEGSAKDGVTAKTLFLLDRFCVSDEFYHELTQVNTVMQTRM